ncbi:MAG: DUF5996 family protein [Chloroflexota bacterium]
MFQFPSLESFEPTRATLHNYANAIGVVPRSHGIPHPKWWHISLKLGVDGLATDLIPLPSGGVVSLKLNLVSHEIMIQTSKGQQMSQPMTGGLTGTRMGDWVIESIASLGLAGEYARGKFESDEAREYDPDEASRFFEILTAVNAIFQIHRANLSGELGPIQLWPHGFDLAFEWFGSLQVEAEEHGALQTFPSQLNLGFFPGGDPYFYSNPFPFATDTLLANNLPVGATWHTEGWEGSMLPYQAIVNDPNGQARVLDYAKTVFKLASPTLMA